MPRAIIATAKRTPIGRIGGCLGSFSLEDLVTPLIRAAMEELGAEGGNVSDVILGNVVGPGGNIGRLSALAAGLPVSVPGLTVDRQCGSGLEAINLAARLVEAGAGDFYIAGGVESSSTAPWRMERPKALHGQPRLYSRARFSPDAIGDPDMGIAAENVAERYGVSRSDQDTYAHHSQIKACRSQETGRFVSEIVRLDHPDGSSITVDECPRPTSSVEKLAKLRPYFREGGSVTAGNSCPLNDGAAIAIVVSEERFRALERPYGLQFIDGITAGVDPNHLGIGPVPAVGELLARNSEIGSVQDIDIVEFNEAFASQVLASLNELGISQDHVNVGGGAIALGHPYGASGAILVTRLFSEMRSMPVASLGLATLGVGGGMGVATLFRTYG